MIVLCTLIASNIFAQIDPNQRKSDAAYRFSLVPVLAVAPEPYGLNSVVSYGPFDNYQVSTNVGFAETSICVNPQDPLNFVATDNRITGFAGPKYVYYTTDGGVTWNQTVSGIFSNQGDPVFAADSLGNFYLSVLNNGVLIFKSTDKGATWTSLGNAVSNSMADKEWIWCDQTRGPFKNNVYFAYVNFQTYSTDFWRSTNNGQTWTGPTQLGWGTPNPGPNIATGPNGQVYVGWYGGSGTQFVTSTDGGATFGSPVTASQHSTPGSINASNRYVLKGDIRVNGMPQLAVDLTNGPYRGYIYDCFATNPPGPDAADIYFTRSTDGGQTWNWSSPLRVNDDATTCDQWMCDVSVDNQGRVWTYWWDSRSDTLNNLLTETWGAVSTDGGATFLPNFKISNQNFNPSVVKIYQGPSHYYLGDYQEISGKSVVFPFYCAQGNSLNDFTAYLPDYGMSFQKTIDSVAQGQTSVNKLYIPVLPLYNGTVTYSATLNPNPTQGTITVNFAPSNIKTLNGAPDSLTMNTVISSNVPVRSYYITIYGNENGGPRTHYRQWQLAVTTPIGIRKNTTELPTAYSLEQNFPNPFNPTTVIYFALPKQSVVSLKVYDVLGRLVSTPINNETKPAGNYNVDFNAQNLTSGIYFYRISAGNFTDVKKMILVK